MRLTVDGLEFAYTDKEVLKGVGFEVDRSEILGILGPNGSGKTTLLKCINRILAPRQGNVVIDGTELASMTHVEIARNLGFVPQNARTDLCTPTVYEIVLMGRRPHITWQFSRKDEDIAWKCMEEMDVKNLANKSFDSLSSGQSQRVLMARALAQEASVLLLDEPTSNLDVKYQIEVMEAVRSVVKEKELAACAIVHDLDLAMRFCDKAILLSEGRVIAAGRTEDVITPDNIREAFGVEAAVEHSHGRNRVIIL